MMVKIGRDKITFIKGLTDFISKEMRNNQVPAVSIAFTNRERIIWQAGFGWQDKQSGIEASPQTVYRVGSISKLFTAVAIMQLHEKSIIDIDRPIHYFCPELRFRSLKESETPITLRHLLSHRAGILRESPVGNYFDDSEPTISETVKSIIGSALIYPVGEKCKYSNLGPTVAGYILEKVTGLTFEKYIDKNILEPLEMHSSSFLPDKHAVRENLAEAFMVNFDSKLFPAPAFQLGTMPAGNLYSTVTDLANFMICMLNEGKYKNIQLLARETVTEMFTPQFNTCSQISEFGLGFSMGNFGKFKKFWHNGIVYGFSSDFTGLIEPGVGLILLNNVDSAVGFNEKIKSKAFHLFLESMGSKEFQPPPKIIQLNSSILDKYIGKYHSKVTDAWIWVNGSQLFINTMGVNKQISPISNDRFITDDRLSYGMEIKFRKDTNDKIVSMKAGVIEYEKGGEYAPDFSVPENMKKFVGDYGKPHNILRIFVKDGQLTCLIEWFYEYPLTQIEDLVYVFPKYGLYDGEILRFEQNEQHEIMVAIAGSVRFEKINGD